MSIGPTNGSDVGDAAINVTPDNASQTSESESYHTAQEEFTEGDDARDKKKAEDSWTYLRPLMLILILIHLILSHLSLYYFVSWIKLHREGLGPDFFYLGQAKHRINRHALLFFIVFIYIRVHMPLIDVIMFPISVTALMAVKLFLNLTGFVICATGLYMIYDIRERLFERWSGPDFGVHFILGVMASLAYLINNVCYTIELLCRLYLDIEGGIHAMGCYSMLAKCYIRLFSSVKSILFVMDSVLAYYAVMNGYEHYVSILENLDIFHVSHLFISKRIDLEETEPAHCTKMWTFMFLTYLSYYTILASIHRISKHHNIITYQNYRMNAQKIANMFLVVEDSALDRKIQDLENLKDQRSRKILKNTSDIQYENNDKVVFY